MVSSDDSLDDPVVTVGISGKSCSFLPRYTSAGGYAITNLRLLFGLLAWQPIIVSVELTFFVSSSQLFC